MRWITGFILLMAIACQNRHSRSNAPELSVIYGTALRAEPGEKSKEILQLEPGDRVTDLKEVSTFVSDIIFNDTLRQEPWLLVQLPDGRQGWIFAGALRPAGQNAAGIRRWLLQKRFAAFFGPDLAQRWQSWTALPEPRSDTSTAIYYREGLALRDTLNLLISRLVTRQTDTPLPDLFWLNEWSSLFMLQQVNEGTSVYLFTDFRVLNKIASTTAGKQDDAFAQVCLETFPADSIESALPVWVFPLSAESSYSNLGQGNHLKMLRAVDRALLAGDLFRPELLKWKNRVLEDITGKDRIYWQPEEKILAELKKIRESNFHCLDNTDRIALEARYKMFESPSANGIVVDVRSGR
ncbi:MAG: SH3 domain-containing protein [Thermoanaerobaculia bacterium]|nr:SH3 domain-containing protein [Thermoanaerobaculia bacterium]